MFEPISSDRVLILCEGVPKPRADVATGRGGGVRVARMTNMMDTSGAAACEARLGRSGQSKSV